MSDQTLLAEPSTTGLLRRHAFLAGLILAYAALAFGLSSAYGEAVADDKIGALALSFARMVPQMVLFVLIWRLFHLTYVQPVENRYAVIRSEVTDFLTDRERMTSSAIAVALMTLMLVSFAQIKNLIPTLNPFSWDVWFMELDRTLHFGVLPHKFTHAVFGGDLAISFFVGIYNLWLFMMYFVLLIACFLRPGNPVRMQYLVAFVLTWGIGGNLLAILFSSAGPIYFDVLGLGDAYSGLMTRLYEHAATGPISAVETQELLWHYYTMEDSVSAISAFPSMHVASSTLMAVFAFQMSRRVGLAMSAFALGIMIGSVLLGWHYAVDGYVGAAVAVLSWYAAGWLVRLSGRVTGVADG